MEQWRPIPPEESSVGRELPLRGAEGSSPFVGLFRQLSHLRSTIRWLGWGRVLAGLISITFVGWGAFFLLRSPGPPLEASLPYATTLPASTQGANSGATQTSSDGFDTGLLGPELVTIHVAGHVISPGVYRFSPGVRVVDAVRAAGGTTQDADLNAINLAAALDDGQQIYIPALGEQPPGGAATAAADEKSGPTLPLNLNQATVEDLDILPGIGPSTALAIVTHRNRNGPFVSIEGLLDVPGIGPAKLAALTGLVTV